MRCYTIVSLIGLLVCGLLCTRTRAQTNVAAGGPLVPRVVEQQKPIATERLLATFESYLDGEQRMAWEHPCMQLLRQSVAQGRAGDVQFGLDLVQRRFDELTKERMSLLQTSGLLHVDVVSNAIRLSAAARILAGQGDSLLHYVVEPKRSTRAE
jgi:hypothetical protein